MLLTEAGMDTLESDSQPSKAQLPMLVTPSEITTLLNDFFQGTLFLLLSRLS